MNSAEIGEARSGLSVDFYAQLPRLDHTTLDDFTRVYEPSDDTFLLCDAICKDAARLLSDRGSPPALVCEIGTGSGCVITYAHNLYKSFRVPGSSASTPAAAGGPYCLAVDVNPDALQLARRTAKHNGAAVDLVLMDLLSSSRLNGLVDVLIFNPPYVVTDEDEFEAAVRLRDISASWAGGCNGRRVTDRLLPQIQYLLTPGCGVAYLLLVRDNRPREIARLLGSEAFGGLKTEIIIERQARNEHLLVMRVSHSKQSRAIDSSIYSHSGINDDSNTSATDDANVIKDRGDDVS